MALPSKKEDIEKVWGGIWERNYEDRKRKSGGIIVKGRDEKIKRERE